MLEDILTQDAATVAQHHQTAHNGDYTHSTHNTARPTWDTISPVIQISFAENDPAILREVKARFPNLVIPDPHGAELRSARLEAVSLGVDFDESFAARVRSNLQNRGFDDEIANETLAIYDAHICSKPATSCARRDAMRAAEVLYRLENPTFPLTDAGNGERFAFHNFDSVRFCAEWKKFVVWNGKQWQADNRGVSLRLAKETARRVPDEAKTARGEDYAATLKWAIKSESRERLLAMLQLAASEEGMTIGTTELDANQWLFNCQNGTFNLATNELQPHDKNDFISKISPVDYDSHATCPQFLKYLDSIFRGNRALIRYLQRVVGYSLTGDTREQILLVLHGGGSNGKSILIRLLLELFGDYGHTMEPATISAKSNEKMATDIAELFGKRFVACSETNDGRRLDESAVKRMTGGEQITGERKFENPFTFTPQFQIFFATNHKPDIRGTDHGIWRRVKLVPFEVKFWKPEDGQAGLPELQADLGLFEKLRGELPGILKWAVEGCQEWLTEGLGTPDEVRVATADYRAEQDVFGAFIEECCIVGDGFLVTSKEIYAHYEQWVTDKGEFKQSKTRVGKILKEKNFHSDVLSGGRNIWRGIGLKAPE